MARAVSRQRLNTARNVGSKLVRDPEFRASLPADESGERNVLVFTSNERMRGFFSRTEEVGLPCSVGVRHRGKLAIIHVRSVESPEAHLHDEESAFRVHPNITLGMMVDALWQSDGSLLVHLFEPEEQREIDYEVVAGV